MGSCWSCHGQRPSTYWPWPLSWLLLRALWHVADGHSRAACGLLACQIIGSSCYLGNTAHWSSGDYQQCYIVFLVVVVVVVCGSVVMWATYKSVSCINCLPFSYFQINYRSLFKQPTTCMGDVNNSNCVLHKFKMLHSMVGNFTENFESSDIFKRPESEQDSCNKPWTTKFKYLSGMHSHIIYVGPWHKSPLLRCTEDLHSYLKIWDEALSTFYFFFYSKACKRHAHITVHVLGVEFLPGKSCDSFWTDGKEPKRPHCWFTG